MDIGIIARRYARALLLFSCEHEHETIVYEQAQKLQANYGEVSDIRRTIENPMVDKSEKIKLLQNATDGEQTCEELMKFFNLLLEQKREKLLAFIFHSFLFLYRKKKRIRQGTLITAVPLPDKILDELRTLILQRYRGRTVEFRTKVDPDIIGGAILGIGYWRIDASISGQLKSVKKQFIEKNRRIV
ncbi:MAG: F0F1 ATP synthase subunit delta [Paraprevotella sp.]|nr:F0F1 ATP synthase subunit delta [Paraprevotella sp.]